MAANPWTGRYWADSVGTVVQLDFNGLAFRLDSHSMAVQPDFNERTGRLDFDDMAVRLSINGRAGRSDFSSQKAQSDSGVGTDQLDSKGDGTIGLGGRLGRPPSKLQRQ